MAHSITCLSAAIICAVENQRDYLIESTQTQFAPILMSTAQGEFRQSDFVAIAEGYLADKITNCRCA